MCYVCLCICACFAPPFTSAVMIIKGANLARFSFSRGEKQASVAGHALVWRHGGLLLIVVCTAFFKSSGRFVLGDILRNGRILPLRGSWLRLFSFYSLALTVWYSTRVRYGHLWLAALMRFFTPRISFFMFEYIPGLFSQWYDTPAGAYVDLGTGLISGCPGQASSVSQSSGFIYCTSN